MIFTAERSHVAGPNKTVSPLGAVEEQFGEKAGLKRRINWLFKAGAVDCFRVNYLTLEDRMQSASYWVEVNDGKIVAIN